MSRLAKLECKPENESFKIPSGDYFAFINDPDGVEEELIKGFSEL